MLPVLSEPSSEEKGESEERGEEGREEEIEEGSEECSEHLEEDVPLAQRKCQSRMKDSQIDHVSWLYMYESSI